MTQTWFTADTHFWHTNIIKFCDRPFANAEEMNEKLIENWNARVQDGDEVWHLGDFAFGSGATTDSAWQIFKRLKGHINFIEGNHDKVLTNMLRADGRLSDLHSYKEIEVNGQRIVLFHYGLRTWHHDLRGVWHLYGHSHGELPPLGKSVDVGVDGFAGYAPVSFDQLKIYMDGRDAHKAPMFKDYNPTT